MNTNKKEGDRELATSWILQFQKLQIENQRKRKTNDKSSDVARELRQLWNMWITVLPIGICALETAPKRI